eukprot:3804662-Amphidinium_carterae.1
MNLGLGAWCACQPPHFSSSISTTSCVEMLDVGVMNDSRCSEEGNPSCASRPHSQRIAFAEFVEEESTRGVSNPRGAPNRRTWSGAHKVVFWTVLERVQQLRGCRVRIGLVKEENNAAYLQMAANTPRAEARCHS